ncbi:hypothetical protein A2U01_0065634, partial [Trifolium medium]|nr:hypothetical protein [Trifolium medium]
DVAGVVLLPPFSKILSAVVGGLKLEGIKMVAHFSHFQAFLVKLVRNAKAQARVLWALE